MRGWGRRGNIGRGGVRSETEAMADVTTSATATMT